MENEIFKMAVQQGLWAVLFVVLLFYILKEQKKRDEKAGEREANYQGIIAKLTDRLKAMDDVGALCTSTTVGSDTFKPFDKFGEIKVTGVTFTTTDNKVYTVNPTTNKPFKKGSVVCYSNGTVVTPDSIDYTNGTVTFNIAQTGTMTFDYTYMYKFKIMMYKPS